MTRGSLGLLRWGIVLVATVVSASTLRRFAADRALDSARLAVRNVDLGHVDQFASRARRFSAGDPEILVPLARGAAAGYWGGEATGEYWVAAFEASRLYGPLWHRAAVSRLAVGDSLGAKFALDRALRLAPTDPRVRYLSAVLAFRDGDYARFRSEAVRAESLAPLPEFSSLPWHPGDELAARREALVERAKLYPRSGVECAVELGAALARAGRLDEAVDALGRARSSAGARSWLLDEEEARIRAESGAVTPAIELLDRSLSSSSLSREGRRHLLSRRALILTSWERADAARVEHAVAEALEASPGSFELALAASRFHFLHGRPADSVRWAREATRMEPNRPDGWAQLGESEYAAGNRVAAREALVRAVRLGASLDVAYRYFDRALEAGDVDGARPVISDLLARHPDDVRLRHYSERLGTRGVEPGASAR